MKRQLSFFAVIILILFTCSLNLWSQGNTYSIKVKLSDDMKKAEGIQRIEYVNPTDYSLEKLYFRIAEPQDEEPQCQVKKISDEEGSDLNFAVSQEYPGIIEVSLPHPLESKEKINLIMHFTAAPQSRPEQYIYSALSYYWHPKAVPYYEGELQPFYGEIASYQVEVQLPAEKTVVTSGDVISVQKSSQGMKKVISQATDISNFGLVFFDDIEKKESMVKGIKLTIYYAPGIAEWTKELEPVAADIITFYIDNIGFYPEKVINIIPGAIKYSTGGFPLASGIIAIHTLQERDEQYARWITAHEIAHYYWGFGYVLYPIEYCNWLGIGMGIYTDRLYSEAQSLDRYLYNRLRDRYISGALLGFDTTIMQKMERLTKAHFDWNNVIMHGKSFTVIEMLEQVVGHETFHKIFITLLERYKYKVLTANDFQAVCEEISGRKLEWFFQPWLYTNDKLDYVISQVKTYKKEGKFLTRIEVKKTGQISMPIEVEITTIDEEKYSKIFPRQLDEGWIEFHTPSSLKDVKLDPSERLPLFSRINDEIISSLIYDCYSSNQYALSLIFFDEALMRSPDNVRWLYYKGEALVIIGKFDKALNSFQKIIDLKGKNKQAQNFSVLSHIRRGQVFDLQGRRELALAEYKKAIELPDYQGSHKQAKKYLEQPYREDEE
jgi:tetratricopeptide (TPR) repeat protein